MTRLKVMHTATGIGGTGQQTKTFLGMGFVIARTFAQHDILQQWRRYLQLFMEGRS